MLSLVAGLTIFVAVHSISSVPGLREQLVDRLGENAFKGIFSLLSLVGIVLASYGKAHTPFVEVWQPLMVLVPYGAIFMLPAMLLFCSSVNPGNIKRLTPHPLLWSVFLWSTYHLLVNGDLGSVVFFGSFWVFSVFKFISLGLRGVRRSSEPAPVIKDVSGFVAGLVCYLLLVVFHENLFGVPAIIN